MKFGITYRLFFSILGATSLAILSLFLIMGWSIHRGFYQYLGAMNQELLERATENLGQLYAGQGNWDFLHGDPESWIGPLLKRAPERVMSGRMNNVNGNEDFAPPFLQRGAPGAHTPFIILDAERKTIFGPPDVKSDVATFRPIVHQGKTVGYAGLLPPRHFLHPMQVRFLSQQSVALALAAAGLVLAAVLISLPLANRLVKPIKAMAAATHDIASGTYGTRIPVSSSDELGRLARDFNDMALTLEKHEKDRRQWIADISHELRTPVAVLRGEIEALLDKIREVTPDRIRSLHAETLRLNRLIDDLYQLALSDVGALSYRKKNVDCLEVLEEALGALRQEFAAKNIALRKNLNVQRSIVFADPGRIGQLFTNVLENSLRYTDGGGEAVVTASTAGGRLIIEVSDTKPGVGEQDLPRLFDRLFRTEGSRSRSTGGAGLGLAICKNVVEAHGGAISAHASPLGGLLLRIELPLAENVRD